MLNTMVFTYVSSNLLIILIPLMPSLSLAIGALLLRFSISQINAPSGKSYTVAVVDQMSALRRPVRLPLQVQPVLHSPHP